MSLATVTKLKRCVICKESFKPWITSLQRTCSVSCAYLEAKKQREKKEAEQRKQNRLELKHWRVDNRTYNDWATLAEKAFNRYVRLRDYHRPCITCGKEHVVYPDAWHAGHYRNVKCAKQLRWNLHNVNKQCSQCNKHESGKLTAYRSALIERHGLERVLELENDHRISQHDIEYAMRIRTIFSRKANRLRKRLDQSLGQFQ